MTARRHGLPANFRRCGYLRPAVSIFEPWFKYGRERAWGGTGPNRFCDTHPGGSGGPSVDTPPRALPPRYFPAARRSAAANASSFAGSFTPGALSIPLLTSTNFAPLSRTAAPTFSAVNPPARIQT
jgi:hypothetical protein